MFRGKKSSSDSAKRLCGEFDVDCGRRVFVLSAYQGKSTQEEFSESVGEAIGSSSP